MEPTGRHSRHLLFAPIGIEGQRRIESARIAVVGCGALGSRIVELLARAGAGRNGGTLRIIDRDYVDESNLQRQALFDEADARSSVPKASAAARHLREIDSNVSCDAFVRDLNPSNAERLIGDVHLIIDGTDNFRTRFLVNDVALLKNVPWVYGAAIGSRGIVAAIVPGGTPCLRCYMSELPPLGAAESCDTAGIITPLPSLVASLQVVAALRWIVEERFEPGLLAIDLWPPSFRKLFESVSPDPDCASCGTRELPALNDANEDLVTLCGRNSVQIRSGQATDLDRIAEALGRSFSESGTAIQRHPESVTADLPEARLTVFDDGRIIVEGTTDPLVARSIIGRYLGG